MEDNKKKVAEEQVETNTEEVVEEPATAEIDLLKAELEKAQALANDYKDKWMRNVAEFDNYKKRNAKVYSDAYSEGASDVILKILPIGDNLDWALGLGLDEKTAEGIIKLKQKFIDTLKGLEVEEINPIGEKFDPNIAEAIMQVDGDNEESEIVKQVFERGYKHKNKIIRYAKVSVTK